MQHAKITLAVLAALSLTACGQSGLSAGAKGSEALETGETNALDIKKDQSQAQTVKQTRDMLGSTLFANALTAAVPITGLNPATFFDATFHGDLVRPHALAGVDAELIRLGFGTTEGTITEAQVAAATTERDRISGLIGLDPGRDVLIGEKLVALEKVIAGDYAGAHEAYRNFVTSSFVIHVALAAHAQQVGISIDEVVRTSGGNLRTFPNKRAFHELSYGVINAGRFTSAAEHKVLRALSAQTGTPAHAAIIKTIVAEPDAWLKLAKATAAPDQIAIDVTPAAQRTAFSIQVRELSEMYVQGDKGIVITRNGNPWFGEGHDEGEKISVVMDDTATATINRTVTIGSNLGTKGSESIEYGVDLKPR